MSRDARARACRPGATCAPTAASSTTGSTAAPSAGCSASPAAPAADRGLPGRHRRRRRAGRRDAAAGAADRRRRHPRGDRGWSSGSRSPWPASRSSAPCSRVGTGWLSSRIGEGLIFDLRTQVFGHVQRQSLAFFTRTQTGALVSPAQQRRHRRPARLHLDAVQHRLQRDRGGRRRHRDARAELAGHPAVPGAVPAAAARLALGQRPAGRPDPRSRWTATPTWATR